MAFYNPFAYGAWQGCTWGVKGKFIIGVWDSTTSMTLYEVICGSLTFLMQIKWQTKSLHYGGLAKSILIRQRNNN